MRMQFVPSDKFCICSVYVEFLFSYYFLIVQPEFAPNQAAH